MGVSRLLFLSTLMSLSLAACQKSQPEYKGHFVIPDAHLNLLSKEERPKSLASKNGLHVVEMNETQIRSLSHLIHENKPICGGFMTVDGQLEGRTPMEVLNQELQVTPVRVKEPYKIQYEKQVQFVLTKTKKERLEQALKYVTSFPDRYARSENGVKAATWLHDGMLETAKKYGRTDVTGLKVPTPNYNQFSVVIKIPGTDSSLPAVLIGGHMDTYQNNKPGADDDGTGTATVIEVFETILQSELKFKRDLYFAFYAAEEWGLHGSNAMAKLFKEKKVELRGVMQFDMTGYKSPKDREQIYLIHDYTYPALTEFSAQLIKTYLGIPVVGATKCGYACSDHASWTKHGYPATFPFEASFENYNRRIHTSDDTMNVLDMDHAHKFAKLGTAFAVELGEPVGRLARRPR